MNNQLSTDNGINLYKIYDVNIQQAYDLTIILPCHSFSHEYPFFLILS